jgi:two-component system sensor histidine kinase/response regulator
MASVLVIEDEELILENVCETLELEGFEVYSAENGRIGIQLARKHLPDVIVCDVMMPETDGHGVLVALRSEPATSTIPFIFLTAMASKEDMRHGMELGADDYVTKPFTSAELINAVNTRLHRRAVLEAEYQKQIDDLRDGIVHMLPHELRSPLVGIIGYSELLERDSESLTPDRVAEMARAINSSGARLQALIEKFLIYAQTEVMLGDPVRIEALRRLCLFDPAGLIEYTIRDQAGRADRASDLVFSLEDVPALQCVQDNFKRIIDEIIENALKFSPAGTAIEVASKVTDGMYTLTVVDHGRGMGPDEIASIGAYKQFGRQLYEQQGTGLGLIIVKRLTELHGGEFRIESEAGVRTAVHVSLPTRESPFEDIGVE